MIFWNLGVDEEHNPETRGAIQEPCAVIADAPLEAPLAHAAKKCGHGPRSAHHAEDCEEKIPKDHLPLELEIRLSSFEHIGQPEDDNEIDADCEDRHLDVPRVPLPDVIELEVRLHDVESLAESKKGVHSCTVLAALSK